MANRCSHCGAEVDPAATLCPYCGRPPERSDDARPAAETESLEQALQRALEELDRQEATRSSRENLETSSLTPEPGPPAPDQLEDPLRKAVEELDQKAGAAPSSRDTVDTFPRKPRPPRPAADRRELEEALKNVLEQLEREQTAAPPRREPAPPSPPKPTPARPAIEQLNLDETLKKALDAVNAPALPESPARAFPITPGRGLLVGGGLLLLALVWYGIQSMGEPEKLASSPAPSAARVERQLTAPAGGGPRAREVEQKTLDQALRALRDVQSVSRPDVSYTLYSSRVAYARLDTEPYLRAEDGRAELKSAIRDVLALHALAAEAWNAKNRKIREWWEAVGADPAIELCPPVARDLDRGLEPPDMPRAQWRGVALAAAIPSLWQCAADRIAAIDKTITTR